MGSGVGRGVGDPASEKVKVWWGGLFVFGKSALEEGAGLGEFGGE